jgi:hypothetical protein
VLGVQVSSTCTPCLELSDGPSPIATHTHTYTLRVSVLVLSFQQRSSASTTATCPRDDATCTQLSTRAGFLWSRFGFATSFKLSRYCVYNFAQSSRDFCSYVLGSDHSDDCLPALQWCLPTAPASHSGDCPRQLYDGDCPPAPRLGFCRIEPRVKTSAVLTMATAHQLHG